MKPLEHLSDEQLLHATVAEFARATELPLVFGGYLSRDEATVAAISGNRTGSLMGLRVAKGRGLGGRAIAELRPRLTSDYGASTNITHDYDREVLDEGVVTLVAIPVVAAGSVRAVLYGGAHMRATLSQVFRRSVSDVVESLARELRVRDEVRRRTELASPALQRDIPAAQLEELRASYAELRSIVAEVSDPEVRARLAGVEERLVRLGGSARQPVSAGRRAQLTPRELDVLSQVALGASNAEVGRLLGLTEGTVKTYLKTVCAKLGCSNRHAAVNAARAQGLIP